MARALWRAHSKCCPNTKFTVITICVVCNIPQSVPLQLQMLLPPIPIAIRNSPCTIN